MTGNEIIEDILAKLHKMVPLTIDMAIKNEDGGATLVASVEKVNSLLAITPEEQQYFEEIKPRFQFESKYNVGCSLRPSENGMYYLFLMERV